MSKLFPLPDGRQIEFADDTTPQQMEQWARENYPDLFKQQDRAPSRGFAPAAPPRRSGGGDKGALDAIISGGWGMLGSFGDQAAGTGALLEHHGIDPTGGRLADWGEVASDYYAEKGAPYRDESIDFSQGIWQGSLGRTVRGGVQEMGPTAGFMLESAIAAGLTGGGSTLAQLAQKSPALVKAGVALAQKPKLAQNIVRAIPMALGARAGEGAAEAGQTLKTAKALGMTEEEANQAAANTLYGNMPLAAVDIVQFGILLDMIPKQGKDMLASVGRSYLSRLGAGVTKTLLNAAAEGQEEAFQQEISNWAIGEGFDPKVVYNPLYAREKHPESWNIGALTGFAIQGGVTTIDKALNIAVDQMTPEEQRQLLKDETITPEQKQEIIETARARLQQQKLTRMMPSIEGLKPQPNEVIEPLPEDNPYMQKTMDITKLAQEAAENAKAGDIAHDSVVALKNRWQEIDEADAEAGAVFQPEVPDFSANYTVGTEEDSPLVWSEAKKAFRMADNVTPTTDGLVAEGQGIRTIVKAVDVLRPNEEMLQAWGFDSMEQYYEALLADPDQFGTPGVVQMDGNTSVILLARGLSRLNAAKLGTLKHEIFHEAMRNMLSPNEREGVLRRHWAQGLAILRRQNVDIDPQVNIDDLITNGQWDHQYLQAAEEAAADNYASFKGQKTGWRKRIDDFFKRLRKIQPDPNQEANDELFEKLRNGDVTWQQLNPQAATSTKASMKAKQVQPDSPMLDSTEGPGFQGRNILKEKYRDSDLLDRLKAGENVPQSEIDELVNDVRRTIDDRAQYARDVEAQAKQRKTEEEYETATFVPSDEDIRRIKKIAYKDKAKAKATPKRDVVEEGRRLALLKQAAKKLESGLTEDQARLLADAQAGNVIIRSQEETGTDGRAPMPEGTETVSNADFVVDMLNTAYQHLATVEGENANTEDAVGGEPTGSRYGLSDGQFNAILDLAQIDNPFVAKPKSKGMTLEYVKAEKAKGRVFKQDPAVTAASEEKFARADTGKRARRDLKRTRQKAERKVAISKERQKRLQAELGVPEAEAAKAAAVEASTAEPRLSDRELPAPEEDTTPIREESRPTVEEMEEKLKAPAKPGKRQGPSMVRNYSTPAGLKRFLTDHPIPKINKHQRVKSWKQSPIPGAGPLKLVFKSAEWIVPSDHGAMLGFRLSNGKFRYLIIDVVQTVEKDIKKFYENNLGREAIEEVDGVTYIRIAQNVDNVSSATARTMLGASLKVMLDHGMSGVKLSNLRKQLEVDEITEAVAQELADQYADWVLSGRPNEVNGKELKGPMESLFTGLFEGKLGQFGKKGQPPKKETAREKQIRQRAQGKAQVLTAKETADGIKGLLKEHYRTVYGLRDLSEAAATVSPDEENRTKLIETMKLNKLMEHVILEGDIPWSTWSKKAKPVKAWKDSPVKESVAKELMKGADVIFPTDRGVIGMVVGAEENVYLEVQIVPFITPNEKGLAFHSTTLDKFNERLKKDPNSAIVGMFNRDLERNRDKSGKPMRLYKIALAQNWSPESAAREFTARHELFHFFARTAKKSDRRNMLKPWLPLAAVKSGSMIPADISAFEWWTEDGLNKIAEIVDTLPNASEIWGQAEEFAADGYAAWRAGKTTALSQKIVRQYEALEGAKWKAQIKVPPLGKTEGAFESVRKSIQNVPRLAGTEIQEGDTPLPVKTFREPPEHLKTYFEELQVAGEYNPVIGAYAEQEALKDVEGFEADNPADRQRFEFMRWSRHYGNLMDTRNKIAAFTPANHYGLDPDALQAAYDKVVKESASKEEMLDRMTAEYYRTPKKTIQRAQVVGVARELKDRAGFKKLVGKTKAVDEEGNPIILLHGTASEVDFGVNFDPEFLGRNTGAASANMGFFFATNSETANTYTVAFNGLFEPDAFEEEDAEEVERRYDMQEFFLKDRGYDKKIEELYDDSTLMRDYLEEVWDLYVTDTGMPDSEIPSTVRDFGGSFYTEAIVDGSFIENNRPSDFFPNPSDEMVEEYKQRRAAARKVMEWLKSSDNFENAKLAVDTMKENQEKVYKYEREAREWADDPENIKQWEATREIPAGPRIIPVVLNLENPLIVDYQSDSRNVAGSYWHKLQEAKQNGHDGAIFRNTFDPVEDDIYIAFEPNQIFGLFDQRLWEDEQGAEDERAVTKAKAQIRFANNTEPRNTPLRLLDDWFRGRDRRGAVTSSIALALSNDLQDEVDRVMQGKKTRNIFRQKTYTKVVRDFDRALHIYMDMQRDPQAYDRMQDAINNGSFELTPEQERLVNLARNEVANDAGLVALAERMRAVYDEAGAEAKRTGVINNMIEHFVNRSWKGGKTDAADQFTFDVESSHRLHRTLPTIFDGWMMGLELVTQGSIGNLVAYRDSVGSVIENRALIEKGRMPIAVDGSTEPILTMKPPKGKGYVVVDHPAFTVWEATKTVKGEIPKKGKQYSFAGDVMYKRYYVAYDADGNILRKGEGERDIMPFVRKTAGATSGMITERWERKKVYAEPKLAKKLNRVLSPGFQSQAFKTLLKANSVIKSTILMTSFFHHQAFMRSFWLGTTGKAYRWDEQLGEMVKDKRFASKARFIRAYKEGLKAIAMQDDTLMMLREQGLTIGNLQDYDEIAVNDTVAWLREKPGIGRIVDKMGEFRQRQSTYLFKRFGAGLKAQAALIEYHHNLKKYGDTMTPQDIAKLTAELINEDFGGLHFDRMGVSSRGQEILRMLLLAPDWTGSNLLTVKRMVLGRGKGRGTEAEREVHQRFWKGVLMKGIATSVVMNVAMALAAQAMGDDDREYGIKGMKIQAEDDWKRYLWMDVDITPIYNALMPKKSDGRRRYFSILGHFKDPMKWAVAPTKAAVHKGSPFISMVMEGLKGKDWKDDPFTTLDEFLGIDEKGYYKTDGPGHKAGDPKGGKFKHKLTKRYSGYGDDEGVIGLKHMPSFIAAQAIGTLPVQVQEFIGMAMGERDHFDGITRSLGFHEHAARGNDFDIAARKVMKKDTELKALRWKDPAKWRVERTKQRKVQRDTAALDSTRRNIRRANARKMRNEYLVSKGRMSEQAAERRNEREDKRIEQYQSRFMSRYGGF